MRKILVAMLAAVILLSTLVVGMPFAKADDTTSPVISDTSPDQNITETITPANGATNIPITTTISITFSEAMDQSSVQSAFSLSTGSTIIAGSFSWSSNSSCTFTPLAALAYLTNYNISIGTGAMSSTNVTLANEVSSLFTTAPDTTPPEVKGVSPIDGALYVDLNTSITVSFSEAMNQTSAESAFRLIESGGTSTINGTFSWIGTGTNGTIQQMVFRPSSPLNRALVFNISISAVAKDLVGNALALFSSQFVTGASPDMTPRVLGINPVNGARGVDIQPTIEIVFSMAMNQASAQSAFSLIESDNTSTINGTFSWSGNTMNFIPSIQLNESTIYIVKVDSNEAMSANSTQPVLMAKDFTSKFTTKIINDKVPPIITCPPAIVYASDAIVFNIKDVQEGLGKEGIEWNFLTVIDNGVDAYPSVKVNEITGDVTLPAFNTVGNHTIDVSIRDMTGNYNETICTVMVILPPGSPSIDPASTDAPKVYCNAGNGKITITWTASDQPEGALLKCVLYRGTSQDRLGSLAIVTGNHYVDYNVTNNQQYYYQVRVVYELGQGTPSSIVEAMPHSGSLSLGDSFPPIVAIGAAAALAVVGLVAVTVLRGKRKT